MPFVLELISPKTAYSLPAYPSIRATTLLRLPSFWPKKTSVKLRNEVKRTVPIIQNWARLIQKIYEVDPLLCPKCGGAMRVIAFIEEQNVIEKILKHLGLWLLNSRAPPRRPVSRGCEEEAIEQPPPDDFFPDPDHSWDNYL